MTVSPSVHAKSSTRPLAALLASSTDGDLARNLERRDLVAGGVTLTRIRDFYDLANALLAAESLQDCLTRMDRYLLRALTSLSTGPQPAQELNARFTLHAADLERLHALYLVHETSQGLAVWPEVAAQLSEWPALGMPATHDDEPEPGTPATDRDPLSAHKDDADHLGIERAFASTTAMAELLFDLEREPVRLLATGKISRPGARRLAELLPLDDTDIAALIDLAEHAGLAIKSNRKLIPSARHGDWLELGAAERWVVIADAWAHANWSTIRSRIGHRDLHGAELRAWLEWNFPGGKDWLPALASTWLAEAELLGIWAHATITTPGMRVLTGEGEAAAAILAKALPTPIDRLYLQHDLTAVATGPLESGIDARLRGMAEIDGHDIASRYRFTTVSITRAISGNETAASILEFLTEITLSGIPQPLEYLVTETAARHGLLRVGPLPSGDPQAVAYIRSNETVLLRTVLVDRNLASLRLRPRDSEYLVSGCERELLYIALRDAKYPVAMEDSHGRIVAGRGTGASAGTTRTPQVHAAPQPYPTLVARLRASDEETPGDSDEAWLARQLDGAIRSKSTVTVSVRMPNGSVVDFRLEPSSISGGRLRARDPLSEIERTLPLSSIAAVSDD